MRCGRGSKYEDARKMYRTEVLDKKLRKMEKTTFGEAMN